MAATPTIPSQFVKTITIGGSRSPGRLVILNGEILVSDGSSSDNYNLKIDGENKRILINDGADDRVLIGYDLGGF